MGSAVSTIAGAGGSAVGSSVTAEELANLRKELTEQYRRSSECSKQVLEMANENKRLAQVIQDKEREIAELQGKCKRIEDTATSADDTIKDKELTLSILRGELRSLQVKLIKSDEDLRRTKEDLDMVCALCSTSTQRHFDKITVWMTRLPHSWRNAG